MLKIQAGGSTCFGVAPDKPHKLVLLLIQFAAYSPGALCLFLQSLLALRAWGPVSDFTQQAPSFYFEPTNLRLNSGGASYWITPPGQVKG